MYRDWERLKDAKLSPVPKKHPSSWEEARDPSAESNLSVATASEHKVSTCSDNGSFQIVNICIGKI